MKAKITRAKKFVQDNQFAFGILAGGLTYMIARGDFPLDVTKHVPSDAPQLFLKDSHVKYLLNEDSTVLFEHPIANLILHAEPKN